MSSPEPTRSGESAARSDTTIRLAGPGDVPRLLELFRELAVYEHLEDQLRGTAEQLHEALFGERPAAEALIAERLGEVAGYALYFPTFSSFLAVRGVWLEDLFVYPSHRRAGVGKALIAAVAARTREHGDGRLEWDALDWNELALGFYRKLGARTSKEWITHVLDGEALRSLAAEAGG